MPADLPRTIGRYQVERLLGAGAMGNVYLGRDPELDRLVALKTVRYASISHDSLDTFLERFKNEARAAAKLHQRSIVQVYDVGEDAEVGPYLVFEYVPGSTLKQILKARGPLSPEAVCLLADEVADALAAAHHHKIIHRDLKPDNLLVTEDGHTKLADFGVARLPNADLTREGQFLGTPCYAAPETLRQGLYGPETDLFSMATVLYEAVTGVRAFPGDDAVAVAHKVIHDVPDRPSVVGRGMRVPKEVDAVFRRALEKDPRDRFATPHDLARALRAAYEDAGMLEHHGPPSSGFPLPNREPSQKIVIPPSTADTGARSLATVAVAVGTLVVGIALVIAFNRAEDMPSSPDGGLVAPTHETQMPRRRPTRLRSSRRDAGFAGPTVSPTPIAPPPSAGAVPSVSPEPSTLEPAPSTPTPLPSP